MMTYQAQSSRSSWPPRAVVSILFVIGSWQDFVWHFLVVTGAEVQPSMVVCYRLADRT